MLSVDVIGAGAGLLVAVAGTTALALSADPDVKGDPKMEVFGAESTTAKAETKQDFLWSLNEEPHFSRRKEIMKKHPEVKTLFGYAWETKWIVTFLVALQLGAAYVFWAGQRARGKVEIIMLCSHVRWAAGDWPARWSHVGACQRETL